MKKLFLFIATLTLSAGLWAGTGTGTLKDPFAGEWDVNDLKSTIKAGDYISLDCVIFSNDGESVKMDDDKIGTEIVRGWALWAVKSCMEEPYEEYKDYVGYNSDWHNHIFVVTEAHYGTYFFPCLFITGHFSGYYSKDEFVAELDNAWNALPDDYKDDSLINTYIANRDSVATAATPSLAQDKFLTTLKLVLDQKAIPDSIARINALVADETNADLLATAQSYVDKLRFTQFHRVSDMTDLINQFTGLHAAMMKAVADIRAVVADARTEISEAEEFINRVKAATTIGQVESIYHDAEFLLTKIVSYNRAGYAEALGTLGEEQPGPAVKVTKGDKSVILYNPEKVEFMMNK